MAAYYRLTFLRGSCLILSLRMVCSLSNNLGCNLPDKSIDGYMGHQGDIIIRGTFPIHLDRLHYNYDFKSKPLEMQCQRFATEYYEAMHSMIFAVGEINADSELLSNLTLGFQIFDTCISLRRAAHAGIWMLSGEEQITPNYHCERMKPLAGIVGDSGSTRSILMSQIWGLNRYPQISYFATNPILSDRNLFPSFFRTIPSDEFQMNGLAHLVSYFHWSWVGLLASDDDYGQFGIQVTKQEIINTGACVAFVQNILTGQPDRNAPLLVKVIKDSAVTIIVVIASDSDFLIVVEELLKQNVTGIVYVASEAWATSSLLSSKRYQDILIDSIGFAIHGSKMPEFTKYLNMLNPFKDIHDPFIKEFWETTYQCKWQDNVVLRDNTTFKACTGSEKLDNLFTEEKYRVSVNVYIAVYAFAWALQNLIHCSAGAGPFHHGTCSNISSFLPWQLLTYIKNVNFKSKVGGQVFFDIQGNPPAIYDIVDWRQGANGTLDQETVGRYELNTGDGKNFKVNNTSITWANHNAQVPLSKCSPNCPPGFRKVMVPGKPPCCYDCAPCPQGHISNQTDAVECYPYSWDFWPNVQQDRCLRRSIQFLSNEEPLGCSLAAITIFSSLIPLVNLGVFIYHKNTPIVRANNYSLSCLLLVSLFLCFLSSLGFIGYPQPEKCLLRQVAFGMVFTLCISCVLAKTMTVVIAFNATKPSSRLKKWTNAKVSYCVILFCVFIQLFNCATWLILVPPFPELDAKTQPGVIIITCNEGSPTGFWCMLGYLGLLATISFIVAFLAKGLPDNFNEAKFITFSMLAFLSVWVSFSSAYFSARGIYSVAMEIFAILCSSWAVLVCIFFPKCFIILFYPELNLRDHIMKRKNISE